MRHKAAGTLYKKADIECDRDVVMSPNKKYPFVNFIVSVVSTEGPIHIDLLMERTKELSGISRAGANVQSNFDAAIKVAIKNGYIEKNKEDKGLFMKLERSILVSELLGMMLIVC